MNPVFVTVAQPTDVTGYLALAPQVEHWFGPMVNDPGFHRALDRNIRRGTAMCVHRPDATGLRGGILFARPYAESTGWSWHRPTAAPGWAAPWWPRQYDNSTDRGWSR